MVTSTAETLLPRKGPVKGIAESLFELECRIARAWAKRAHKHLMSAQWRMAPAPEWFDHSIDLYYQWGQSNNSLWVERGVFSSLALKGGRLLELSCGDGFNMKHFYAHRSKHVVACDFDPTAVSTARKKNRASNVRFVLADIRTQMPEGQFGNIVWDAAIEHFTAEEIASIMDQIKLRLNAGGVLSGYTIVERNDGPKHIHQHEYEFKDMHDLRQFLTPHLKNVKVFETIYPERHNLYFWASDGVVPFDRGWPHAV